MNLQFIWRIFVISASHETQKPHSLGTRALGLPVLLKRSCYIGSKQNEEPRTKDTVSYKRFRAYIISAFVRSVADLLPARAAYVWELVIGPALFMMQ